MSVATVLLVDDDPVFRATMSALLADDGYDVHTATSGDDGLEHVRRRTYDVVISDLRMPGIDGLQLLPQILRIRPEQVVLMVTGFATVEGAVQAIRHGAFDFIRKPCPADEFLVVVARAAEKARADRERLLLREKLDELAGFGRIIGASAPIRRVLEMVRMVAETDSTVLVRGETGTGKELVARAIHDRSTRAERPFVAVNCAALTETLLESEFFGHERGAFTGAIRQKRGKFELANGGTLFLDEIGEISAATQLRLLRVLQERRFERVGGTDTIETDVRIIAATNRELESAVGDGSFRSDLFFRLNVFPVMVPPLRERMEDVPALALEMLSRAKGRLGKPLEGFSEHALSVLMQHTWPGNVRELENVIHRAAISSPTPVIDHIEITLLPWAPAPAPSTQHVAVDHRAATGPPDGRPLTDAPLRDLTRKAVEEIEERYLREGLSRYRGNVTRLAQVAGLDRRSIFEKLKRYNLRREDYRRPGDPVADESQ